MPFPNENQVVLVEQPSYNIYLRYLEMEGIPLRGIARSAQGIDFAELEELFKDGGIKFFYTMARNHNPLGTTYCTDERKAIARLASQPLLLAPSPLYPEVSIYRIASSSMIVTCCPSSGTTAQIFGKYRGMFRTEEGVVIFSPLNHMLLDDPPSIAMALTAP